MSNFMLQLALAVIPAVLAITLHEAAHGYAALALGDPTARLAGRLSLNPIRHIDRFGTIILPGILLISQLIMIGRVEFMFGWAKPVPINPWAFVNPRRGMMWVALAGPGMNFFLAWLAALAMRPIGEPDGLVELSIQFLLLRFVVFNLVLGLFNLLPLPPLDGGRVVV
ncbi:MAG: site-2 protease family protein, partial [Acetobacteraceae bacterium]|nr:site-2 protease family protein [Acetobacteraceae bacterium]